MPNVDPDRLKELGGRIESEVIPFLEEANEILPQVRELDPMLMVSVDPSLAAAHALASGYMIEMVQGAAECFVGLNTDLAASAQAWEDADAATESDFK